MPTPAHHPSASIRHTRALAVAAATLLAATLGTVRASEPESAASAEPYMRLRESTLGYHGVAEDFVDLTEIRLGWFGPSDPEDPVDGDLWWAASLAVDEANREQPSAEHSGFAALPIRLIPRWAPDPWRAGVSLLARMVYDEQPLALLGSVDSASTHLAEQVVAKVNLPLVSPVATDKTATLAGVSWMFACAPADSVIAEALVSHILSEAGGSARRIVLLTTTDHESRMTAREVARELARRGVPPEFRFDLPPEAADASEPLRRIAGPAPDFVIVLADAANAARIARAVRDRFGGVAIYGGPTLARTRFLELAGSAAESIRVPVLFAPEGRDATAQRFAEKFAVARHHAPDYTAALAYDATRLLIDAIRRAGPNRARIREALVQVSPWSGIAGPITFDGTGQNRRANLPIGTIHGGVIVPVANLFPSP